MDTNTVNSKGWYSDSLAWLENFSAGVKNKVGESLEQAKQAVDSFSMVPASPSLLLLGIAGCGGGKGEDSGESGPACIVYNEIDLNGTYENLYSLRYMVELYNNGKATAICNPPEGTTDNDGVDPDYQQAIYFMTDEWDTDNYYSNHVDDGIVLDDSLTFNNSALTLVVGNYSPDTVPASADDYGMVRIDGRTNGLTDVFSCNGSQPDGSVTLRNIAVQTDGTTKTELFDAAPCLVDGGAVYVCGGEVDESKQPGETGWCPSE